MDLDSVTDASDHKAKLDLYRGALSKLLAQPSPAAWQEFADHGAFSSYTQLSGFGKIVPCCCVHTSSLRSVWFALCLRGACLPLASSPAFYCCCSWPDRPPDRRQVQYLGTGTCVLHFSDFILLLSVFLVATTPYSRSLPIFSPRVASYEL